MRISYMKHYGLDRYFEFSEGYLFFWNKIECSHSTLNKLVEIYKGDEEGPESEKVMHILDDPVCDGGNWYMFAYLVEKYGVMPIECFPDTSSTMDSKQMNELLNSKMREFAHELFEAVMQEKSQAQIDEMIKKQTQIIFK